MLARTVVGCVAHCAGALAIALFSSAGRAQEPAKPRITELERKLVARLQSEPDRQLLYVFEHIGEARHVPALAELLAHDDTDIRSLALSAMGLIAQRDPSTVGLVRGHLGRALCDGVREVRQAAIYAYPTGAGDDWRDLLGMLADPGLMARITAASVLARSGVLVDHRDIESILREAAGTGAERWGRSLFDQLRDPADVALLRLYIDSIDGSTKFRAREAIERIEAVAGGAAADWRPHSQVVRESAQVANRAAAADVFALPWQPIESEQLLKCAEDARLVMVGEFHVDEGLVRDIQKAILRRMVAAAPGHVVVGFEPSVESAQRSVLDLARELGAEVLSLETDWRDCIDGDRYFERDDQAAVAINRVLATDPQSRMLVIRGGSHVMPGGYLIRQLAEQPVVVLTDEFPPFATLGERPTTLDRVFRRSEHIFCWGTFELFGDDLRAALAPDSK